MKSTLLIALVLVLLALVDAKHHHRGHGGHKHHRHHHKHHHLKFMPTTIVNGSDECPTDGKRGYCADLADECQETGETASPTNPGPTPQTCQPRDSSFLDTIDKKYTGPWQTCHLTSMDKNPTQCLFGFECLCDDYQNTDCTCRPSDSVRLGREKDPKLCESCEDDEYCRYNSDMKKECAPKPYPLQTKNASLYEQCGGSHEAKCGKGLECYEFSSHYSICLKDDQSVEDSSA